MERRQRRLGPLAGIGAALILGGVAFATATQSGGERAAPPGPLPVAPPGLTLPLVMPQALLGRLAEQLALTVQQRQAIRALLDEARPGLTRLHRQMQAGAELLARTAPDDAAYPSVVASVSQSTADLAAEFVRQSSRLRSAVHAVLTPGQRARLAALEAERLADREDRAPQSGGGGASGPE